MSTNTYNSDGPECPHCGHVITPDDPDYFASTYTKDNCPECHRRFAVEVNVSVAWRCSPIDEMLEQKP